MREFVNAANVVTTASLAAGSVALLLAGDGRLGAAAAAIGVAALLDSIDGVVARRLSVCGPFGCQLDSLADLVAFGAAPAMMLHHGILQPMPLLGGAACLALVLAGAWRLARFPLVQDPDRFVGLPIPPAGLIAAAAAVVAGPAALGVAVTFALALLMISAVRFPTLAALARPARQMAAERARGERPEADAHGAGALDATSWRSRGRPRAPWPARASRPPRRRVRP
jgi:CDP-diacylglycerol---serine O-phosphatidyltransferase